MANSSGTQTSLSQSLTTVLQQSETTLNTIQTTPFSHTAFSVLKEKVAEYIVQLISESMRIAKRHQSDTVSAAHVQRASEYLIAITSRRFLRHLGTFGGILLGGSISSFLAMIREASFPTSGTLVSAALGIVGSFLIALYMAKD